jgi:Mg-chelatase subunit ChlD
MGAWKRFLAALALCAVLVPPVLADSRKDNIDVIIALDKSLSMENKIGGVREWVNSSIIDQLLIPGDTLVVVAFYGKADVIISQTVKDDADKKALQTIISKIRGNGRFTDIGNALDVLRAQVTARQSDGREKYILLLTDGIQEAPPGSKYFSKDGKFNHEFLANTKTIQEKGWKIMILGIGTDTAAKDLAHELKGTYNEVSETTTAGAIAETTGAFFGTITTEGGVQVGGVSADGSSKLSFNLKASGLQNDARITLNGVTARIGTREIPNVLPAPFKFGVKKDGPTHVTVPLRFPADLPQGPASGALTFSFGAGAAFSPSDANVSFVVNNWLQNNLILLICAAVIVLLLVALLAVAIWRLTRGKPLRFALTIDEEPVGEDPVSLSSGHELYLNETAGEFSLVTRRNAKSLARFSVKDAKLLLGVLKQDRFPKLKEVPPDARGRTFVLRSENGRRLSLKVQSRERTK